MSFLTPADVRIAPDSKTGILTITTSDAAYDRTRSILLAIRDLTGLDISFHSEQVAAMILNLPKRDRSVAIKTDVAIPRSDTNEFFVVAWKSNIRGKDDLNTLSEELKSKIEEYGLSCRVFPCI